MFGLSAVVAAALGAACPNGCSLRGVCGADGTCTCFTGFVGDDCSKTYCAAHLSDCSGHGMHSPGK